MNRYSHLTLSNDQLRNSINLQVLAHLNPKRINWPPDPWHPISGIDKILKGIRNGA